MKKEGRVRRGMIFDHLAAQNLFVDPPRLKYLVDVSFETGRGSLGISSGQDPSSVLRLEQIIHER